MESHMKIKEHVWLWICYTFYFYLINLLGNPELPIATVLLSVPGFMYVFYSISWILEQYFSQRKYWSAGLGFFTVYGSVGILLYLLTRPESGMSMVYGKYLVAGRDFQWRQFLQNYLVFIGHFTFLAVLSHLNARRRLAWENSLREMEARLKEERLRKEFQYSALSLPVPSHLLVNVFQSWHNQLHEYDLPMKDQLLEMYELIRFFMICCLPESPRTISLAREIEVCQQYQRIQEQLAGRPMYIDWKVSGNIHGVVIPPTSLLTLLMNVFKHGDVFCQSRPVRIRVDVEKNAYLVRMENALPLHKSSFASHGLGLANLKQRLDFVFKDRASLSFGTFQQTFKVELKITDI